MGLFVVYGDFEFVVVCYCWVWLVVDDVGWLL